jgi:hypothetical protein
MVVAAMTPVNVQAVTSQRATLHEPTQVHEIAPPRASGRCTSGWRARKAVIDPDTFVPSTDVFPVPIRSRLRNNKYAPSGVADPDQEETT